MHNFDRKTAQLCAAIERTLAQALACDIDDPALDDVTLDRVEAVDGGGFVAVLTSRSSWDQIALQQDRLRKATPVLREALAHGLTRKRVPLVSFLVMPAVPTDD